MIFHIISAQRPQQKNTHTSPEISQVQKSKNPTPHFPTKNFRHPKKIGTSQDSPKPKCSPGDIRFSNQTNTTKLSTASNPPRGVFSLGPGISLSCGFVGDFLLTKPDLREPRDPYMRLMFMGKFESVNISKMSCGSIMGSWKSRVCQLFAKKLWETSQICKDVPFFCNTSSQSLTDGLCI